MTYIFLEVLVIPPSVVGTERLSPVVVHPEVPPARSAIVIYFQD